MWGKIRTLAFLLAAAAVAFLVHDWIAARRDAAHLKATLSTEKKVIDAASQRENQRNRDLQAALTQIEILRKQTKTPQQAAAELQKFLQLPVPIAPGLPSQFDTSSGENDVAPATPALPTKPQPKPQPSVPIHNLAALPATDILPLYNYVQDCRECQLKLVAANANLSDQKKQIDALTRERDAALVSKQHGLLRGAARNLIWVVLGVGAGALVVDTRNTRNRPTSP